MKLGDVLRKERERRKLTEDKVAAELGLTVEAYNELENGSSPVEEWGLKLAQIAIKLFAPTSRLISETGRSKDAKQELGQCGKLIKAHREKRQLTEDALAALLEMPIEELSTIESGNSPLEFYAPMLLRFSELIEQPIFNLFYPCGLPLSKLEDYP
ncbi:MAG TPA: helix-turn-helix transcriptional regulator [Blastocatellia bacterium]|nr:helix-turn-helix transcriptional regulator [Blastocatellia bacterium]